MENSRTLNCRDVFPESESRAKHWHLSRWLQYRRVNAPKDIAPRLRDMAKVHEIIQIRPADEKRLERLSALAGNPGFYELLLNLADA
jgi:hypothetical protein